jgi:cob(I)alamin adenosyltransferase
VDKDHFRIEAIGSLDELNAVLGIVKSQKMPDKIRGNLQIIQKDIMALSSALAYFPRVKPSKKRVREMELVIDKITRDLPKLNKFLIPGVNLPSSYLHFSRAICRRAERNLVRLAQNEDLPDYFITYLNRLADLLFSLAYWCQEKIR